MLFRSLSVWRDPADGKVYVVNGHHRLSRAIDSGYETVNVRFIQAKDAAEARVKGAMQNIAEEKGTAVDAAKVMRDSGMTAQQMIEGGVSPSGRVMADAVPLTRLPQHLFDKVSTGGLDLAKAVALGSVDVDQQVISDVAAAAVKKKWSAEKIVVAMHEARFALTTVSEDDNSLLKVLGGEWEAKESDFSVRADRKSTRLNSSHRT